MNPRRLLSLRLVLAAGVAGCLAACAAAPSAPPLRPVPAERAEYLRDPSTLAAPANAAAVAERYRRLLAGEPATALRQEILASAAARAPDAGESVLLAQIDFVGGDAAEARDRLMRLSEAERGELPARLLLARATELAGDPLGACRLYRGLAVSVPVAGRRLEALRPAAAAGLRESIEAALRNGRAESAADDLALLSELAPAERTTFELSARVARARDDLRAELAAVRGLAALAPGDLGLQLRRGELEVEAGDATNGLAVLEALVERHPDDPAPAASLARAKFTYRLLNAPEAVRRIARSPQLSRADFARLLYWLVPAVRSARPGAVGIATDVLGHPAQEEIVRVANLGLLRIDPELHQFDPERPVTRFEVFRALSRLAGSSTETYAAACGAAVARGWITESGGCLPGGPVTGVEAVGWLRDGGTDGGGGR